MPTAVAAAKREPLDLTPRVVVAKNGRGQYTVNGRPARGVTTACGVINKPKLLPWAGRIAAEFMGRRVLQIVEGGNAGADGVISEVRAMLAGGSGLYWEARKELDRVKKEAGDKGTAVHEHIEKYLSGRAAEIDEAGMDPQVRTAFLAFQDIVREIDYEHEASELMVGDPETLTGGRLDAVGWLGGRLAIMDWKSGSGIYAEAMFQVAAYRELFDRTFGVRPEVGLIVHVRKEPKEGQAPFQKLLLSSEEMDWLWKGFLDARRLYDANARAERLLEDSGIQEKSKWSGS